MRQTQHLETAQTRQALTGGGGGRMGMEEASAWDEGRKGEGQGVIGRGGRKGVELGAIRRGDRSSLSLFRPALSLLSTHLLHTSTPHTCTSEIRLLLRSSVCSAESGCSPIPT